MLFLSCRKNAVKEDIRFVGIWYGSNNNTSAKLKIERSSVAVYYEYDRYTRYEHVKKAKGRTKIIKEQLHIGRLQYYFNITSYPKFIDTTNNLIIFQTLQNYPLLTYDTASWEMWLDGKVWYRK